MSEDKPEEIKVEEKIENNEAIIYEDEFEEPKSSKKGWVITGVVVVLILIAFLFWANSSPSEDLDILAYVNGEPVYASAIDARYDQLPAEYKAVVGKDVILNQTIEEMLLLQEAKSQEISVSDEEVNTELNNLIAQNGMSKEQFEEYLFNNGIELESALEQIRNSLVLRVLLENELDVSVDETEIQFYYEQNKNLFKTLESRDVSHVLICYEGAARCEQDYSKDKATELINEVLEKAETEDFAELAKEYSTGPSAPMGGSLGLVDENTAFVPEFKAAALELGEGEVSGVVETDFGFHIIKVNALVPAKTYALEEVRDQIEATIMQAKSSQLIAAYLLTLREEASIQFVEGCDVDGLIFYGAEWCPNCKETSAIVDELIAEGNDIMKVEVSDNDLVKSCFGAVMKEQIPQFICKKDAVVGQLSKEEIVELVEKCD